MIKTVVTRGFGSFGSIKSVVTRGFIDDSGGGGDPEPSTLAGRRQGAFSGRSSPMPRNRLKGTLTAYQGRKA